MKFKIRKLFRLAGLALALTASVPLASAQLTPTSVKPAITNTIACLHASTNLSTSQLITNTVAQGKHLGIAYEFVGQDATNNGTIGLRFKTKVAGSNNRVTTGYTFTLTDTANGTTAVRGWQVIPDYTLGPVDGVILANITNAAVNVGGAAGSVIVSNVWLEWRN